MRCTSCGNTFNGKKYPKGYCSRCYTYFRLGGKVHPIPPSGVVAKDEENKVICHICGKSYTVLGGHIRGSHHMTIKEYKEQFGLCNNSVLTEDTYHDKMHDYALHYDMDKQLIRTGVATRIGNVPHLRLGKKSRLQECLAKRNRKVKVN